MTWNHGRPVCGVSASSVPSSPKTKPGSAAMGFLGSTSSRRRASTSFSSDAVGIFLPVIEAIQRAASSVPGARPSTNSTSTSPAAGSSTPTRSAATGSKA